jgi:arylsulfatase A-like enzyme
MNRFASILISLSAVPLSAGHLLADVPKRSLPNFVFILADDLGWSDTTLNGGTTFYETPNVHRLAARGIRFTHAYAANPLCSPTRTSILTGLYPGRVGITAPACHLPEARLEATLAKGRPGQKCLPQVSATRLRTTYPTLAKSFKEAGYVTGHFGKWHLGREPYSALQHGFDVDMPHTPAAGPGGGYLGPWNFWKGQGKPGEHIEDRMADEAAQFIRAHRGRPFYLNYWAFSVHGPWQAKPELVKKYEAKAAQRPADAPQRNPVYAAMVESFDRAVGKLLDTLDELQLANRTILVLFSDNGGVHWLDDRMRTSFGLKAPPTSNAPLRGGKATLYEGGTREPCVVIWPGKVKPGTQTDALLSSVDWYPTLLDMAGLRPMDGQQFDGISQVPALLGTGRPRDTVYCFFPHYTPATGNVPGTWVRRGDWKLIRFHHDGDDQVDRFELYDLKDDPGEMTNLASKRPEKVQDLDALIGRHLADINALVPPKNPAYR